MSDGWERDIARNNTKETPKLRGGSRYPIKPPCLADVYMCGAYSHMCASSGASGASRRKSLRYKRWLSANETNVHSEVTEAQPIPAQLHDLSMHFRCMQCCCLALGNEKSATGRLNLIVTNLRRTPPSSDALRHSGGASRRCTSAMVTLYLEVELSSESLPGTEQKTSPGIMPICIWASLDSW